MEKKAWHQPLEEKFKHAPPPLQLAMGGILILPIVILFFGLPFLAAFLTNTGKAGIFFFSFFTARLVAAEPFEKSP